VTLVQKIERGGTLRMPLSQSFAAVRLSVVAFMPSVIERSPDDKGQMFPIVGTGVILDDGLVVTNAHVVETLLKLARPPNFPKDKFPFVAVLFHK
jgi:S1-C subfamily serine protease